jgi:hypothetical protein
MPHIQVDRSVGPKAAQLAAELKVTYQHARGSLDVFWEGLADRRILAQALDTARLVLTEEDLTVRLRLAFGMPVDLGHFVSLGFLEPVEPGKFRVRGASRYIDAEIKRLKLKRGSTSPQPQPSPTSAPPEPDLSPASTPPQPHRGKRSEVRGKPPSTKEVEDPPPPPSRLEAVAGVIAYEAPSTPPDAWDVEDFYAWFQHARQTSRDSPQLAERRRPNPRALSSWWSSVHLTPGVDVQALIEGVARFAADPKWRASDPPWPWAAWQAQWSNYTRPRRAG